MLNVLLVDDEKLERVLIRKGYNWEENGFNIVEEATSGKDALEYINYHNVDIVMTVFLKNSRILFLRILICLEWTDCSLRKNCYKKILNAG